MVKINREKSTNIDNYFRINDKFSIKKIKILNPNYLVLFRDRGNRFKECRFKYLAIIFYILQAQQKYIISRIFLFADFQYFAKKSNYVLKQSNQETNRF